MSSAVIHVLASILLLKTTFVFGDPCNTAEIIQRGKYRGTKCHWRDGKATNDRDIVKNGQWYKAIDENGSPLAMSTKPSHEHLVCSTKFPIWLNGSNPRVDEDEVSYKACVADGISECDESYDIVVKNCTQFLVYQLSRPRNLEEAYCFGENRPCPPTDPCEDIDRKTIVNGVDTCTSANSCDDKSKGWFLIENSGQNLQISDLPPGPGSCGFHIWMRDPHPDQSDGIENRNVCVANTTSDCAASFQLSVVNCGAFFVYNIQNEDFLKCSQRYCFNSVGSGIACNVSSEAKNRGTYMTYGNAATFGVVILLFVSRLI